MSCGRPSASSNSTLLINSRSVPYTVIKSPPVAFSPGCFENPVTFVCPNVRAKGDSASFSAVRTTILPPLAGIPAGASTLIISLLTLSKLVTFVPPGNSISVTLLNPEPLMVIGWLVTTFVGKNALKPNPMLAEPLSSFSAQAVKVELIRTTASSAPKKLIICFIILLFSIFTFNFQLQLTIRGSESA